MWAPWTAPRKYHRELLHSHQEEEADWLEGVIARSRSCFVKIVPERSGLAEDHGVTALNLKTFICPRKTRNNQKANSKT